MMKRVAILESDPESDLGLESADIMNVVKKLQESWTVVRPTLVSLSTGGNTPENRLIIVKNFENSHTSMMQNFCKPTSLQHAGCN